MRLSLFRSGPIPRVAIAALYAVFAFGSVALVERASARRGAQSPTTQTSPAPAAENTSPIRIEIESVNAVAMWTVHLDGIAVTPVESSPTGWYSTAPASSHAARITIDATRTTNTAATNALRVRLARGTARFDRTFWCTGDCVFDVSLAELSPAR